MLKCLTSGLKKSNSEYVTVTEGEMNREGSSTSPNTTFAPTKKWFSRVYPGLKATCRTEAYKVDRKYLLVEKLAMAGKIMLVIGVQKQPRVNTAYAQAPN